MVTRGKESAGMAGDPGSIPGLGGAPGGGHGNPLQDSRLKNSRDRGAWRATVHRVVQSWTRLKRLSGSSRGYPLVEMCRFLNLQSAGSRAHGLQ